jgi:myo-inositol-1(or 4)-monophosphatase
MELKLKDRERIKEAITSKIRQVFLSNNLSIQRKEDKTLVTEIDLFISSLIKNELNLEGKSFLSEEDQGAFTFPLYILDPIDGTRELVHGIPECCLSLAFLQEDKKTGWGWIYNPFTGFDLCTEDSFVKPLSFNSQKINGLVSSSEWAKSLYPEKKYKYVNLAPRGSIAFKLGLLASGACDFVITKKPKSIWDIAAGTILCWQRGIELYHNGQVVKELGSLRLQNDMIWCRPEQYNLIIEDLYS